MTITYSNEDGGLLSKIATNNGDGENSPYFDGWKAYDSDPYHPTLNRDGVIQMGLAENQLCFDLIQEWIEKNPSASICTSNGSEEFKDIAIFQDYHGLLLIARPSPLPQEPLVPSDWISANLVNNLGISWELIPDPESFTCTCK